MARYDEKGKTEGFPDRCPVTGMDAMLAMKHPEKGWVMTYGGPYDSYTIPEIDEDTPPEKLPDGGTVVTYYQEHYDHDMGGWAEPEGFGKVMFEEGDWLKLEEELEELRAFKKSVDEALNSGDGAYRP